MPTLKTGTYGVTLAGGTMISVPAPHEGPEWSGTPGFSTQTLFTVLNPASLPPGISLAQKAVGTGTTNQFGWKGTPRATGVYTVTVNPSGGFGGGDYQWTISLQGGCALVTLAPASPLPDGFVGVAYSELLSASAGVAPYTYDLADGALPAGLSLSSGGLLSGTPTTLGSSSFVVRATDVNGCPGVLVYTLGIVVPPPITITPSTLGITPRDAAYSQLLTGHGGIGAPYTFAVHAGALPTGLTLETDGHLHGTPSLAGVFSFTVRATDGNADTGDQAYTLTISAFRIDINGVDHLLDIAQADFELGLNSRATAHLVFGDGYIPARLSEVICYARDGVTPVFGGVILTRHLHGQAAGILANAIDADCVDFSLYFDQASVTLSYTGSVAPETVIADVVAAALGAYGLTYTPVATGLLLAPFAWVNVIVTDAWKQVSDQTGLVFRVTPAKAILAFVPLTDPAPVTLTDANINAFDIGWTDGARPTANTVELLCGPSGPGQMTQQWIADGIASHWVTDLPAIDPAPILVEIDDGVTPRLATIGVGAQFTWDRDTHTLTRGTDPLPAAGTKITLGPTAHFDSPFTFYTVQFPFRVRVTTGALPPITYREARPDCVEYGPALEIANGILARESVARKDLDILTDVDGFLPGQALTVNTTTRGGLVADFLIADVRGSIFNKEHWEYILTAQQAEVYQGSYIDQWKALTGSGSSGSSAAAIAAPVATPTGNVTGPSASIASEAALFDGTTGKLLKRATGTGVVHRTSGVDSVTNVVEAEITLADNTTNDVSTAKHGLAPKAPNDATKFLNGANPPAYAAVKESDLSLSDITTNDVSTAKHGLAPKAPSDATKFLNGANPPAWTVPATGVAGLTLLASVSGNNTASHLDLLTRNAAGQSGDLFQSDFDDYVIRLVGIVPATNNVGVGLRVSTDGATFIATGYSWTHWAYGPGGTGQTNSAAGTEIRIIGFINATNSSTKSLNALLELLSPLSTALHKIVGGTSHFYDTTPALVVDLLSGAYNATTALRGLQIVTTSGNIVSGSLLVYGVPKS